MPHYQSFRTFCLPSILLGFASIVESNGVLAQEQAVLPAGDTAAIENVETPMMKPTTLASVWPGRPPSAESLQLYGVVERAAGVHGLLSRQRNGRVSPIAGQGRRAGIGSLGMPAASRRQPRPFLLLAAVLLPLASMAQSSSNDDPPPALRVAPQPACVFDAAREPEMVKIEGGEFVMGSPATENGRHEHEGPQHRVTVQSFALGRCEVTAAQFEQFVAETGYRTAAEDAGCYTLNSRGDDFGLSTNANWRKPGIKQRASHPVGCVTFGDAQEYIAWLSSRTGQAYRLPTEAEWEYAARAGSTGRFSFGDDADATVQCEYANGADQSFRTQPFAKALEVAKCDDQQVFTAPTASFKPNALGLYDMHGNVVEWVEDCYHASYHGAPVDGRAWLEQDQVDCRSRVLRGGSWDNKPRNLRSAARSGLSVVVAVSSIGFRLARTL
jgi:formylglycine-generating enzyme required for sulfatase activity